MFSFITGILSIARWLDPIDLINRIQSVKLTLQRISSRVKGELESTAGMDRISKKLQDKGLPSGWTPWNHEMDSPLEREKVLYSEQKLNMYSVSYLASLRQE